MRVTVMSTVCGLLVYVNPLLHFQFVLCCVACSVLNGWTCYCICLYELRLCGTLLAHSTPDNNWNILTTIALQRKAREEKKRRNEEARRRLREFDLQDMEID
jgi:hypothetical protein